MATSGTWTFNPSNGELTLYALGLCGIKRTEITAQHLTDARTSLNMLFSTWANDTPNLWTVDLVAQVLTPEVATYNVDPKTIMVLDAFIRTGSGESQNDRIIWPISRTEYAAQPNKVTPSQPTTFWFNRQLQPTITLWQPPDDEQTYTLFYYRCVAQQDADLAGGQTADIPPRWILAAAFGTAELLAMIYAPDRAAALSTKAANLLMNAQEQDTENVPLYIAPAIGSYHPR